MADYYTYADEVPLLPGQTLAFARGRGYYARGTPPPPPNRSGQTARNTTAFAHPAQPKPASTAPTAARTARQTYAVPPAVEHPVAPRASPRIENPPHGMPGGAGVNPTQPIRARRRPSAPSPEPVPHGMPRGAGVNPTQPVPARRNPPAEPPSAPSAGQAPHDMPRGARVSATQPALASTPPAVAGLDGHGDSHLAGLSKIQPGADGTPVPPASTSPMLLGPAGVTEGQVAKPVTSTQADVSGPELFSAAEEAARGPFPGAKLLVGATTGAGPLPANSTRPGHETVGAFRSGLIVGTYRQLTTRLTNDEAYGLIVEPFGTALQDKALDQVVEMLLGEIAETVGYRAFSAYNSGVYAATVAAAANLHAAHPGLATLYAKACVPFLLTIKYPIANAPVPSPGRIEIGLEAPPVTVWIHNELLSGPQIVLPSFS